MQGEVGIRTNICHPFLKNSYMYRCNSESNLIEKLHFNDQKDCKTMTGKIVYAKIEECVNHDNEVNLRAMRCKN